MDSTAQQLTGLLIKAIPTVFFFIALMVYLQIVFFKPLLEVMRERRRQTEGVRKIAEEAFAAADQKTAEFERALQAARAEIYKDQEAMRHRWLAEQAETLASARAEADAKIRGARTEISQDVERAKEELASSAASLSEQIVQQLVGRRAA
ncbi:MAG: ATP synthase F0 subunit B [Bryobacteraceae bacterium]